MKGSAPFLFRWTGDQGTAMFVKSFLREDPTVFFACKHSSDTAVRGVIHIVKWFQKYLPRAQLLASPALKPRLPSSFFNNSLNTSNLFFIKEESEHELKDAQLIISCGGDGTLLHVSSIFQQGPCPPVLPFSLGSLGFLSSFDFSDHKIVLNRLFKDRFTLLNRQRLKIDGPIGTRTVLNEILLNRSTLSVPEFHFSMNDDDKFFFPSAIADAMIFASSTGSSGHSLSANGPILHPTLDCGVLNFLAPRTLAFRPLILPVSKDQPMLMGLTDTSKADEVDIHLDGVSVGKLKKNEMIQVSKAEYPMPVFSFFGTTADWNHRLSRCLNWNQPYQNTSKAIKSR